MSNPNTIVATSIVESPILMTLTTAQVAVLTNASASGTLLKLNELVAANYSTSQVTVLAKVYSAAALGGTGYQLIPSVTVPPNSSVVLIDESTAKSITEDKSVGASASIASTVDLTGSYKTLT